MPFNLLPFIPPDGTRALYRQVSDWITQNIREGVLSPGDRLPTVRVLAKHLQLNRGTVASAYTYLIKNRTLQAHVGRGTFVGACASDPPTEAYTSGRQFWEPLLTEAVARIGLGRSAIVDNARDATWVPDRGASVNKTPIPMDVPLANHHLSHALIRTTLQEITETLPPDTLAYGNPQGMYSLRVQIAELAKRSNMALDPQQIMICSGAQQALSLLSTLLIRQGDTVIVENPTYPGATRAFRMAGAKLIGIPMDAAGMNIEVLDRILRDHQPKLIYTIPSFHAPTGLTLSMERRAHLHKLAQKHQVPIVEDEYVNSLYYNSPPPDPIKSLDSSGVVVYIGTFSKTLGASMRLGWLAAHPALIARLAQVKENHDIHSSIFSQLIVERLLRDGSYVSHLDELRRHYGVLYHALLTRLKNTTDVMLIDHTYHGGFSIWAALHPEMSVSNWLVYARARGVSFDQGRPYFLTSEPDRYARLCFSLLSVDEIEQATYILKQSLREALAQQGSYKTRGDIFLPFS